MRPREGDGERGMRMAELSAKSGVARETIHFYLREGLLPKPEKGGRTVAYYRDEHLERLLLIRRLREEKYLPIAVIRRLLGSPAAAEGDALVLADVLHIVPAAEAPQRAPSPAARAEAERRGLLGSRDERAGANGVEPAEARVLTAVEEALALDEPAQKLTLDDFEACAGRLTDLVDREAALFFDLVLDTGDVEGSITALRKGRGAVARFIAGYRDLMLRRIVEELLVGLERGPSEVLRATTIPLSPALEEALAVRSHKAALLDAALRDPSPSNAAALVWHLFGSGASAELAALPDRVRDAVSPRLSPLIAFGAHETARTPSTLNALEAAVERAHRSTVGAQVPQAGPPPPHPHLALGEVLLGEAKLARAVRRRGAPSLLAEAVPALARIFGADPSRDPEPIARAFAWFHRGRSEIALPAVLGRRERGIAALREAMAIAETIAPAPLAAARARILGNASILLGRALAASDGAEAKRLYAAAKALDPSGPLAERADEESRALG